MDNYVHKTTDRNSSSLETKTMLKTTMLLPNFKTMAAISVQ